jgi:hypothetical protein
MRPLSMAFAMKHFALRDWLLFCTRYGGGFLEGETDAQYGSPEWQQAYDALETIANDGVVLHNKGVSFKFLEQAAKNSLPFSPIVEMVNGLYAKCYRGVDLATGSRASGAAPGGNGAKNPVGASVQSEESGIFLLSDCKWATGYANERIDAPLIRYLFGQEPRAFFALMPPLSDTTAEDLQSAQALVPMGLRIALKEAYTRFRWKEPEAGEPCLEAQAAAAPELDEQGNPKPEARNPKQAPEPVTEKPEPVRPTTPAREATAIAPGADPQKAFQTADQGMPDTQVDAGGFWSRAGLMPKGADGQTLPMPSLGYALPQEGDRNQAEVRKVRAAVSHDVSPLIERLAAISKIKDDAVFESKLRRLLADFDSLAADIKTDPHAQQVMQQIMMQGFLRGVTDSAAKTKQLQ